ncbi:unnamed protein product [Staurois parvus]|uniref:Uncharacterized protein n=1 Tax=Staurois parvus TaxID=386267 RepID=A0ABN9FG61_9NEOB|nr:unnamed protein product [Staurois parvus]
MRMSRDLEGAEVSPVIWGELYDSVGRFSKSLMAPSDYRANDVFRFSDEKSFGMRPVYGLPKSVNGLFHLHGRLL